MILRLHDRYFVREMLGPLMISLAAFAMMMSLKTLFEVMDLLTAHRLSLVTLGEYIALKLPLLIQWSLPVALLVGSSLAISRLSQDSELVAMRVAGLPLWRLLIPLVLLGFLVSIGSRYLGETIAPFTEHRAEALHRKLLFESEVSGLQPDTLFRSGNRIYYFHSSYSYGASSASLQGVTIYQMAPIGSSATPQPSVFWTALQVDVQGQVWTLRHVVEHRVSPEGQIIADIPTNTMTIDLHRNIQYFLSNQQTPQEMTAAELATRIHAAEHLSLPESVVRPLRYEYYFRVALPFACLVFALVGAPLTLRFGRGGSLIGILIAFGVLFFYYDVMVIAQKLQASGGLSAWLAAWSPNLVFGALGAYLIGHEQR
jgi:lipopolysaccharide export system permease protein